MTDKSVRAGKERCPKCDDWTNKFVGECDNCDFNRWTNQSTKNKEETASVEIYNGTYDGVPEKDPEWSAELEIEDDWWGSYPKQVPQTADTKYLSENVEYNSGPIEIWCEAPVPVYLCVHTNTDYHDPNAWEKPIELGLAYDGRGKEKKVPYGCEVWGRVIVWVAKRDGE